MTTALTSQPPAVAVERRDLPPIPAAGGREFYDGDIYAIATVGETRAEVYRFLYWDPRDGAADVAVEYEVRIDGGLPDTCGYSKVCAFDAETLTRLAEVCRVAAELLDEAKGQAR